MLRTLGSLLVLAITLNEAHALRLAQPIKAELNFCTITCLETFEGSDGGPGGGAAGGGGGGSDGPVMTRKACKQKLVETEIQGLVHFCKYRAPNNYTYQCTAQFGYDAIVQPLHSFHCDP